MIRSKRSDVIFNVEKNKASPLIVQHSEAETAACVSRMNSFAVDCCVDPKIAVLWTACDL